MSFLAASSDGVKISAPRTRRVMAVALALSLLLNLAILALLDWMPPPPPEPEQAVAVDLAPAPPPSPPKAEPKPEAPKPEPPKPEVKPEPPKPEPPKPETKPEPPKLNAPKPEEKAEQPKAPPPKAEPKIEAPKPLFAKPPKMAEVKPPPMHLGPSKAADKSAEGPGEGLPGEKGKPGDVGAQDLRDLLLSQVLRVWSPPDEVRGHHLVFKLKVDLYPNGMLGPPYAGDQPLNVSAAVADWNHLPANGPVRPLLAGLVRAIYMAQPFHLPPDMAAKTPATVTLDFAVDDIP